MVSTNRQVYCHRAGLALHGMDEKGRFVKITNVALMESACRSTLPFSIEEVQSKKKTWLPLHNGRLKYTSPSGLLQHKFESVVEV